MLPHLFPTCVGMNRAQGRAVALKNTVPHVRGDEPLGDWNKLGDGNLFPTCVGMNRLIALSIQHAEAVPHVRGDEPTFQLLTDAFRHCSPRAWG